MARMFGMRERPRRRLRAVPDPQVTPSEVDDAALLGRVALGETDAFSHFYDRHAAVVFGLVLRVVRNRAMAEEVTQEVFVEVWQQATRFDAQRGTPRGWLTTMAHRRAIDRVRSEEAGRRRDENDNARKAVSDPEPVDLVIDHLDRERVRAALGELSELQRQAIEAAYFGGYTYQQVAQLLSIPEGTAKTRIRDGLIRLRDTLGVTT